MSQSATGSSAAKVFRAPWSVDDSQPQLSYLRWSEPPSSIFGSVYVQGGLKGLKRDLRALGSDLRRSTLGLG